MNGAHGKDTPERVRGEHTEKLWRHNDKLCEEGGK